jgi:hypothetical protein
MVLAVLLHRILVCKLLIHSVMSCIVFLILAEDFRVIRKVLLVRCPFFVKGISFVGVVLHRKVSRPNIVVIDPVLDIFHVVMGHWETQLAKLVNHFFLGILSSIPHTIINAVQLLTEILFCLFRVDLTQLLHLKFVLTHQMLLFLS